MANLDLAILLAETVRGNASADQAAVNAAVNALTSSVETFIGEKQYGTKNSELSKENLIVLIDAAAAAAGSGVVSAEDADDVPPDTQWVPAALMEALTDKITEAETIRDSDGIDGIDIICNGLFSALTGFEDAIEYGTVLNKTALIDAITAAETAKDGVVVAASKAEAPYGYKWAKPIQWAPFTVALNAAITARDEGVVQANINTAKDDLAEQTPLFAAAVSGNGLGEKISLELLTVLIGDAEAAKSGVVAAASADDVPPGTRWVPAARMTALDTKITQANSAVQNNSGINSAYTGLLSALNDFGGAIGYGTTPDKTTLISAITAAETAQAGVVVAASKDKAAYNSKWATAAQWAPFTAALNTAIAVRNNEGAVQSAVSSAASTLSSATATFTFAVNTNGLGERLNTLTITGLPPSFYNGANIIVGLLDVGSVTTYEDLDGTDILGTGSVSSGSVEVSLFDGSEPWGGSSNYWVAFTWDTDPSFLDVYCSRAKVTVSGDTALAYTAASFKQVPYVEEFELPYGVPAMTLDALLIEEEFSGYNGFKADYKSYVDAMAYEEYGITISTDHTLYRNPDFTGPFAGTDTVSEGMHFYTKFSLDTEDHDDDDNHPERGERTGTISGTVSFTNQGSNLDKIDISAYQGTGGSWMWRSYSGRVKQDGSFTIPLYENDAAPGFNPTNPVHFILQVRYKDGSEYFTYIDTDIYGISHDDINNIGPIGTADLAHLVVSGSVTITIPEGTIRQGRVQSPSGSLQPYQGEVQSGAWVVRVPPSAVGETLSFSVYVQTEEGDFYYKDLTGSSVIVNSGGNTGIDLGTVALTESDKQ
jgi:hypothetical protein